MTHPLVMNAQSVGDYVRKVFPQADEYGWRVMDLDPGAIVTP